MRRDKNTPRLLYLIQLPPPVHGVSMMNHLVYHSPVINAGIKTDLLEIKFSDKISQIRKWKPGKVVKLIWLLLRLIHKLLVFKPQYVYFTIMPVGIGLFRDLVLVLCIKSSGARPIFHLHNRGIRNRSSSFLMQRIYRYIFSNSYLIHLSELLLQEEFKNIKTVNCKKFIIPNAVAESNHVHINQHFTKPNLFYLSNHYQGKGLEELMVALRDLKTDNHQFHLVVGGDYPDKKTENKFWNLITDFNLEDRVELKGPLYGKEKETEFFRADIFVFPSFFKEECFPLVILEAMQAGLPIIATKMGSIPEVLTDRWSAILINPRDINGLKEAIIELCQSEELCRYLGKNARQVFMNNYTTRVFENKMRDLYRTVWNKEK